MDPFTAPATFFILFSTVMMAVVTLLTWFVKGIKGDQSEIRADMKLVSNSLVLVEKRLADADARAITDRPTFYKMEQDINVMQGKMLDTIIALAQRGARDDLATEVVKAVVPAKEETNGKPKPPGL